MAVISSIAGTKGLGIAPAYSATKRFQNTYMDALEQLACMKKANIHFTDIRPGFVATALLNNGKHYPLMMRPQTVAFSIKKALEKRKRVVIIDWRYQLIVAAWKHHSQTVWKRAPCKKLSFLFLHNTVQTLVYIMKGRYQEHHGKNPGCWVTETNGQ